MGPGQSQPPVAGPSYSYSYDAMSRATGLTNTSINQAVVSSASYNAANQVLQITGYMYSETRTYNPLNQMTNLTIGSTMNISYNFTAGANNGKITSQTDAISGETVTYAYDSLNRLLSASSNQGWSETYGYDGFGNLLTKTPTGSAPTLSQSVNPLTNQIVGQTYDANGNQFSQAVASPPVCTPSCMLMTAPGGTLLMPDQVIRLPLYWSQREER